MPWAVNLIAGLVYCLLTGILLHGGFKFHHCHITENSLLVTESEIQPLIGLIAQSTVSDLFDSLSPVHHEHLLKD